MEGGNEVLPFSLPRPSKVGWRFMGTCRHLETRMLWRVKIAISILSDCAEWGS